VFKITSWVDAPPELQEYWGAPTPNVTAQTATPAQRQAQPEAEKKSASNF